MKTLMVVMLVGGLVLTGCARTTVKKVVTGNEHGVRYYRPKPYLKLTSSETKDGMVVMALEYLPDFSEEYAIKAVTGIGTNDTEITLNDNGTLHSLHSNTDSKFADNLGAILEAFKALPKSTGNQAKATSDEVSNTGNMEIRAHNVPLGYYEAVVSQGPDCVKRLYGWRYVGFAPFLNCPVEMQGLEYRNCQESLYGLVNIEGEFVFAQLDELASKPGKVVINPRSGNSGADMTSKALLQEINSHLKMVDPAFQVSASDVEIQISGNTVVFAWKGDTLNITRNMQLQEAAKKAVENLIPGGQASFE